MRCIVTITVCAVGVACAVAAHAADDEPQPLKADKRAAQRLEIMRGAIDDFKIVSADPESAPRFADRPLLRYNDQTRDGAGGVNRVLDATVWRLGEKGRPKALVTLEINRANQDSALLTYEFVSLTPEKIDMKSARDVRWMPHSTDLAMTEFDEAPVPADTPKARLVQMRDLARRFTVAEQLGRQKTDLRLLPQPVDRYDDLAADILDGAVLMFANGTNPEMGLLLECSKEKWSYGTFRLAAAKILAKLDGQWVLQQGKSPGWPVDAPYTATQHSIFLPDDDEE